MVLKEPKWSWKKVVWVTFNAIHTHNGTLWGWSWKKLLCTKWWITFAKIDGLGWNFDTIWGSIRVTSGVNLNSLPILLLELSQFECVFNTLSNLLIRVHDRHNIHNGIWKFEFGCVWTCLAWARLKWHQKCWKYTQKYTKCNGLERNQMVLKEPYTSLTLTVLPVFNKNWGKWSWKNSKIPSFCRVMAVLSKNDEICRGFDLSDCLWLGIH